MQDVLRTCNTELNSSLGIRDKFPEKNDIKLHNTINLKAGDA